MDQVSRAVNDLAVANRILAAEQVVDAMGHVSIRNPADPKRFFLSCGISPGLVTARDIVEFGMDGEPVTRDTRPLYIERFIHAAIYHRRPDVNAVVHAHAEAVLPFTITETPLIPVIHDAGELDTPLVWDIADEFGDSTKLLVQDIAQGASLARALGEASLVLMRGHGFVATGNALLTAVRSSVFLPRNARVLESAMRMGKPKPLSKGEMTARRSGDPHMPSKVRAWDYWASQAGCVLGEDGRFMAPAPKFTR